MAEMALPLRNTFNGDSFNFERRRGMGLPDPEGSSM
jgi:hypothetical protein